MNILSITGILPIPEITRSNDFLFPLYTTYKNKYPKDQVYFLRTHKYNLFKTKRKSLRGIKSYELKGFSVNLVRYFSTWRYGLLHIFVSTYSAYFLNRKRINRLIKECKIDVLHAEYIIPDGYLAYILSKKHKIPYLITTHNESRYFDAPVAKSIILKLLRNASSLTPLNYPTMELYKKHDANNNITIIPHGIDERFLQTEPQDKNVEEIKILSVGVLVQLKNFDKVIQAVARLKDTYKISYTLIGSGPEKERLTALVHSLGLERIVNFIDRIPYERMPVEMSQFDIFIMPSYVETFGRVLFEAMAVGLPIICAKNTGIHGYFKEGEEGFSVDHRDIADIESKLSILLSNAEIRRDMGSKAKELMSYYTWDKIVVTFHSLYEKSLQNSLNN